MEKSEALQFYFNNGGKLKFNSIENGIMLKKVSKGGIHANHPMYTDNVLSKINLIDEQIKSLNFPLAKANLLFDKKLNKLIKQLKKELIKANKLRTKVNNL